MGMMKGTKVYVVGCVKAYRGIWIQLEESTTGLKILSWIEPAEMAIVLQRRRRRQWRI